MIALLYSFWLPATMLGWLPVWPDAAGSSGDAYSSDGWKDGAGSDAGQSARSEPLERISYAGRNSATRLRESGGGGIAVTPRSSARSSGLGFFKRSLLAAESDCESQTAGLVEGKGPTRSKDLIENLLFGQVPKAAHSEVVFGAEEES